MQRNLWEAGDSVRLQVSEKPLGDEFKEPARDRIGRAIAESIRRFRRKIQATADGKRRKKLELRLGLHSFFYIRIYSIRISRLKFAKF